MTNHVSTNRVHILIIDGSLGGSRGNTARMIELFRARVTAQSAAVDVVHLADEPAPSADRLAKADGYVFCSGVYWDSWGSPMQAFFENATPLEGHPCWFGKPSAALVTMHSVGGKEVLSRLLGVLNTFGLYVPPMSAMTYSMANQTALGNGQTDTDFEKDLWCADDLDVLAKNLCLAATSDQLVRRNWASWPVDRSDPKRIWFKNVSS